MKNNNEVPQIESLQFLVVFLIFFFILPQFFNQWKLHVYPICYTNEQLQWTQFTAVNELQHQCKLHNMEPNIMNTNMWKCYEMPHLYYLYHFFITIYQPNILKFITNLNKIINFNKEYNFLLTNHHTLL